jgi:SAM-dependent methyltransferase
VHEGYFSDPAVAAPLVREVRKAADAIRPDTMVDLGGGTGFLLSRLRAAGVEPGVALVNLDDSSAQLAAAEAAGFPCFHGSVNSFVRRDIGAGEGRCLFIMRSVLHYFGKDGLRPVLRHLRSQARPGDFFVHQTASFHRRRDADCLNDLYRMMRTSKWYPTVAFLRQCLRTEGWDVRKSVPAPPLRLRQEDLRRRYQLDEEDLRRIRARRLRDPHVPKNVFQTTGGEFCAFLHYRIYVCTPASSEPPGGNRERRPNNRGNHREGRTRTREGQGPAAGLRS